MAVYVVSRKALFLNTDNVSCPESRIGDLVQNIGEAHLVRQVRRPSHLRRRSPCRQPSLYISISITLLLTCCYLSPLLTYTNLPSHPGRSSPSSLSQITETLVLSGLPAREIGIITLYRQQIKLLQHVFKDPKFDGLEILTADKSQGRDKSCILISMVRSNESGSVSILFFL